MAGFWDIIAGWVEVGQALFLLLVVWAVVSLLEKISYYIAVCFQGWPSEDETAGGEFEVGCGTHEIEITTPSEPEQVWVSFGDYAEVPVCQADIDTISTALTPEGFIIYLVIHSSRRHIQWRADL